MNREEKIEIMFESILSELEQLSKAEPKQYHGKVQSNNGHLEEKLDTLIEAIYEIQIPLNKPDLDPLNKKLRYLISIQNSENKELQKTKFSAILIPLGLLFSVLLNIYLLWK